MRALTNKSFFYALTLLFVAFNLLFVYNEFYFFTLLPVIIILLIMAFFSADKLMLFIVFCTPLSLNMEEFNVGFGFYMPTEPLIFGLMLLYVIKLFYESKFDRKVLKHPISISIYLYLFWMFITSLTSEMPIVSIKFFISHFWYVAVFYFMATQLFKNPKKIALFSWMYILPLTLVIIYTVIRHAGYGFAQKPAHWVMEPFYRDHTSYGAIIAMFIPVLGTFMFSKKISTTNKILLFLLLTVFSIGLVFSYTRAAWVSLVAAFCLFIIMWYQISFKWLIGGGVLALAILLSFQSQLFMDLSRNNKESSDNLMEHVESISNVASDASNLERLNRWNCAFEMFKQRPIFGYGPGTYAFLYAPFQYSGDLTIISTNFGNKGNAHSEYFGPLAESGLLGGIVFLLLIIVVLYYGINIYYELKDKELKLLVLGAILGLTTYFVHGTLNNFLDTDKIGIPFWGFIATLVAIDVYHNKKLNKNECTTAAKK